MNPLKDLPISNHLYNDKILKAEAVRRYNFFNKERKKLKNGSKIWLILTGRIEEIIEMNNLTEEEIKGEKK